MVASLRTFADDAGHMPAEWIHLTSLAEGAAVSKLPVEARRILARASHAARLGVLFVDLPYFASFEQELVRYVLHLAPQGNPWGDRTHADAVGILVAVVRRAAATPVWLERDENRAFALGLASHLAIDRAVHPLVNWLAERDVAEGRSKGNHAAAHREVEKFQSICFHETYFGSDMLGTRAMSAHLGVRGMDRLERSAPAAMGVAAMRDALGSAPSLTDLARWGRSFGRYTRILASPLGKTIAPPAVKDPARPRYLHGRWGTFSSILEEAIHASVPMLETVWSMLEGAPRELTTEEVSATLSRVFGPGTIDPPGATFRLPG
ncbi:hypothetical protein AKJ09_00560 [Labilithrix luteola]|uniref:Phospholipase C/D domain-containing protein n=1 Tax=Labilithrix luteola TaxID=1391654 RepID=A0A0K1PKH7_9BACT|nr:hypothetical protein AKJ09_00560 [Labilithrix luteola]